MNETDVVISVSGKSLKMRHTTQNGAGIFFIENPLTPVSGTFDGFWAYFPAYIRQIHLYTKIHVIYNTITDSLGESSHFLH